MKKLTTPELDIARLIQRDILLVSRPFLELANVCKLDEDKVIVTIKTLLWAGIIRKFGAIIRHQKIGFIRNALVVWSVPQDQIEETGRRLAAYDFISHCYERKPAFQTKYNLFTMLHTKDRVIYSLISKIVSDTGINEYLILEIIQEYKKISPEYF
jgi:siroheme decarboxylase